MFLFVVVCLLHDDSLFSVERFLTLDHNSLKSIVTSGGSVLEGYSVGKAMLSCLQNTL